MPKSITEQTNLHLGKICLNNVDKFMVQQKFTI